MIISFHSIYKTYLLGTARIFVRVQWKSEQEQWGSTKGTRVQVLLRTQVINKADIETKDQQCGQGHSGSAIWTAAQQINNVDTRTGDQQCGHENRGSTK